jgi:ribonuclease BN (tRNA processing enzyme)
MKMNKRKNALQLFVHRSLKSVIQDFLIRSYILPARMDFEIQYITFDDDEKVGVSENFFLKGRKNSHLNRLESYLDSYPDLSLFSGSFLFEADDKKIIYTSDIGSEKDLLLFKDVVADVFISEINHISPSISLEYLRDSGAGRIYLTHYSDEDKSCVSEILANLSGKDKVNIELARDAQIIEI